MQFLQRSESASAQFDRWIINHAEGYVLGIRGNQLMLHLASCGHFKFRESDGITFGPKAISLDRNELDKWAREQNGKRYLIWRSCKP